MRFNFIAISLILSIGRYCFVFGESSFVIKQSQCKGNLLINEILSTSTGVIFKVERFCPALTVCTQLASGRFKCIPRKNQPPSVLKPEILHANIPLIDADTLIEWNPIGKGVIAVNLTSTRPYLFQGYPWQLKIAFTPEINRGKGRGQLQTKPSTSDINVVDGLDFVQYRQNIGGGKALQVKACLQLGFGILYQVRVGGKSSLLFNAQFDNRDTNAVISNVKEFAFGELPATNENDEGTQPSAIISALEASGSDISVIVLAYIQSNSKQYDLAFQVVQSGKSKLIPKEILFDLPESSKQTVGNYNTTGISLTLDSQGFASTKVNYQFNVALPCSMRLLFAGLIDTSGSPIKVPVINFRHEII